MNVTKMIETKHLETSLTDLTSELGVTAITALIADDVFRAFDFSQLRVLLSSPDPALSVKYFLEANPDLTEWTIQIAGENNGTTRHGKRAEIIRETLGVLDYGSLVIYMSRVLELLSA